MNIIEMSDSMADQANQATKAAFETMKSPNSINDPKVALQMQYALQQSSELFGMASGSLKTMRDTIMGIISKIG